jgi:hypothetical protein
MLLEGAADCLDTGSGTLPVCAHALVGSDNMSPDTRANTAPAPNGRSELRRDCVDDSARML